MLPHPKEGIEMKKRNSKRIKGSKTREIHFRLSPDQEKSISMLSMAAGLSKSDFLRNVALGYRIIPKSDLLAIKALIKIGGDQARLGRLLKMLLSEVTTEEFDHDEIRQVLRKTKETEEHILKLIDYLQKP